MPSYNHIVKSKYPCWFNRLIIQKIKLKNKVAHKNTQKYYTKKFKELQQNVSSNIKNFWNFVNNIKCNKTDESVYELHWVHYVENESPQALQITWLLFIQIVTQTLMYKVIGMNFLMTRLLI